MANQQTELDNQPHFFIEKYYLKGSSLESPSAPDIFREEWKPKVNLDINTQNHKLHDDIYEVTIHLTVTAKNEEKNKNIYLVEVQYSGIYTLRNFEAERLQEVLGSFCPGLLYPYATQAVSDLVSKAGFPQLNLAPINFDAIYRESLQRQQQENAADHA